MRLEQQQIAALALEEKLASDRIRLVDAESSLLQQQNEMQVFYL